jgi:hypothetical protein
MFSWLVHAGREHIDAVVAEIWHTQVAQKTTAIGMRICAHSLFALGCKLGQFRYQAALRIEELFWPVAAQPIVEQLEVLGMGGRVREGHLVRVEGAFNLNAIDDVRPRPALG